MYLYYAMSEMIFTEYYAIQFCPINRKSPYFLLVLNTKFSSIVTGDEKANAVNSN